MADAMSWSSSERHGSLKIKLTFSVRNGLAPIFATDAHCVVRPRDRLDGTVKIYSVNPLEDGQVDVSLRGR